MTLLLNNIVNQEHVWIHIHYMNSFLCCRNFQVKRLLDKYMDMIIIALKNKLELVFLIEVINIVVPAK